MKLAIIATILLIAIFQLVSGSNATNSTISVGVQLSFTNYEDQDVIPALNITSSQGTTAFQFLNLAAEQNPCYIFQYETFTSLGHYITSICCVPENTTTNFYWFVYINNEPSPVGVDLLKPNNGDSLRFEYRFINSTDGNHTETTNTTQTGQQDSMEKISISVELIFTNYPSPNVIPPQQVIATNGTTAFEILQIAGQVNPCYMFQYTTFSFGHYITTICCVMENKTTNFSWLIYINGKLSPVGVDLLIPKDGDTLKFEYQMWRSVTSHNTPSAKLAATGKANKISTQNLIVYIWLVIGMLSSKRREIF